MKSTIAALLCSAVLGMALGALQTAPGAQFTTLASPPAGCPRVQYVNNVDRSLLLSNFYPVYSSAAVGPCEGGCVKGTLEIASNGSSISRGCCHKPGSEPVCDLSYGDTTTQEDSDNPGTWYHITPPAKFPYYILDYGQDFGVYYSCEPSENVKTIYIEASKPNLDAEEDAYLQDIGKRAGFPDIAKYRLSGSC